MFARQALLLLEPFHQTLVKFSLGLSLNHDPPDLCLPSNWYYWYKSQCSALEGVSFFFFVVLGLELRTYTLSYSTSRFVIFLDYLPRLASNCNPPDLCLLSS
jgi:hypothetical protein